MVEWTIHAYEGTEPYIFVSYAHADAERIQPFLHAMSNFGLNVWFDEGIHSGSDWRETILNHLGNCSAFVFFVTEASLASKECKKEIYFAERNGCLGGWCVSFENYDGRWKDYSSQCRT